MQRQPISVVIARPLEAAGLHLEDAVAAVMALIDPLADGIARERWLDLRRPIPPVSIDAAGVLHPVDQHVGGLGCDDELHRLEAVSDLRHPEAEAGRPSPIDQAALLKPLEIGLPDGLIFRRERGILTFPARLAGVE